MSERTLKSNIILNVDSSQLDESVLKEEFMIVQRFNSNPSTARKTPEKQKRDIGASAVRPQAEMVQEGDDTILSKVNDYIESNEIDYINESKTFAEKLTEIVDEIIENRAENYFRNTIFKWLLPEECEHPIKNETAIKDDLNDSVNEDIILEFKITKVPKYRPARRWYATEACKKNNGSMYARKSSRFVSKKITTHLSDDYDTFKKMYLTESRHKNKKNITYSSSVPKLVSSDTSED